MKTNFLQLPVSLTLIVLIHTTILKEVLGNSVDKDLILTGPQKLALDKFKAIMTPQLKQEYMKQEIYLIKYLRATQFDVELAERMLIDNVDWRNKNEIETILDEDFSYFDEAFPFDHTSVDKEGRPILYYPFGQWDIRRAILSGQRDKVLRYLTKTIETGAVAVRKLQDKGQEVTHFRLVTNLNGFALTSQGCIPCLIVYAEFVRLYSLRYPGMSDSLYFVNTPNTFQAMLNLLKSLLPPGFISVFGTNKAEFRKTFLNEIDADQLLIELGGSKTYE